MKIQSIILMGLLIMAACSEPNIQQEQAKEKLTIQQGENPFEQDTTPRVTGIGGIFFKTIDPVKTKNWYANNLGLAISEYGSSFEFRNANRPKEINYLEWSPFNANTNYFEPSQKDFMINYRVQNIEGLVRNLEKEGVTILDSIASYAYGKFVHILDLDSNKIELWEPIDSVFTEMGGPTTK